MKKPLPEDFLLRPEIIAWCGTRQKELDALSYKQFLPKIWKSLFAVVVFVYIVVLIIEPTALGCPQFSCLTVGEIFIRFLGLIAVGLWLYVIAAPLALLTKWVYRFRKRQDVDLQYFRKYNSALKKYKSHLENRSTADSPSKMEHSNFSDEVTFKYDDEHGQELICSDIDSKQRQGIEEDVLLAHDIASKKQYSNVSDDDIVSAYGDFISENHKVDLIWDVSKLPYPKEIIKDALIRVYVRENITQEKMNAIGVCFTYLSQFQEGVGDEDLSCNASGLTKLHKAHKAGHINQDQFRVLIKEELEKSEKDKVLYGKFDKVVQKEMIEILPEEFLRQTAARKVLIAIIKARKESDKKKSS